ncbi:MULTISPECIES: inverse autotransporter beta domain-containing protein, partial [Enterobacter]
MIVMFSKSRLHKSIAYPLIFLQVLTQGLSLLPPTAYGSEPVDVQGRAQQPPGIFLPSLSSPESPSGDGKEASGKQHSLSTSSDGDEERVASGAMQIGSVLSQDKTSDAVINHARSTGESIINNKVNNWLNQSGNARVSLGTDKFFSGELLLPLTETEKSVFFSHFGARTSQERNTFNMGLGYRQYLNDWMFGINSFYDAAGVNKRIGLGTEIWGDYFKLATNGYLRQTNWHQSALDEMEDFDERPANGFDLRANVYLPSLPNLGGTLMYEQYFGKGVSLSGSTNPYSLKDNPKVVTAGIEYTPFPLTTLSAKRSIGDSNETRIAMDLTYRFGVPLEQQFEHKSAAFIRSLSGSKYEFVDRNYNIAMQYRKQEMLSISLPVRTTAQASETIPVVLSVSKAKHGVKSVNWNVDPQLLAHGGRYQQLSPTELRVTLPAYVSELRGKSAQHYQISAMATDNKGNQSNLAQTLIEVLPSENIVSSLTVSPSDTILPANDRASYTLVSTVTNGAGEPIPNEKVTFSISGLLNNDGKPGTTLATPEGDKGDSRQLTVKTGLDGKARITLRSKLSGQGNITATIDNGNSNTTSVTFAADNETAYVRKVTLMGDTTTKVADGQSFFTYTASVLDKFDNPMSNVDVSWSVDSDNVALSSQTTQTDSNGKTIVKVLSRNAVASNITVSARSSAQNDYIESDKKVSFIAGDIIAEKSTLVASPDIIIANGKDTSTLTLNLVDVNNNPVTGAGSILHTVVEGLDDVSVNSFVEQSRGIYVAKLTGEKAGKVTVTVLAADKKASIQTPTVTLSADKNSAQITETNLIISPDGAAADGKSTNGIKAAITDRNGNPVSGMTVTFSVSDGATLNTNSAISDANGIVSAEVTSVKSGHYTVTASVNGHTVAKDTTFVSDMATSHVSKVVLLGGKDRLPANGRSSFIYSVAVTDKFGNPVAGVNVTPASDKAGVTLTTAGLTDAAGQTTVTLTSTT